MDEAADKVIFSSYKDVCDFINLWDSSLNMFISLGDNNDKYTFYHDMLFISTIYHGNSSWYFKR